MKEEGRRTPTMKLRETKQRVCDCESKRELKRERERDL